MPERGVICGRLPTGAMSRIVLQSPSAWLSLVVDHTASFAAEGAGWRVACFRNGTHTRSSMQSGGSRLISAGSRRRSRRAWRRRRLASREGGLEQQLATGLCTFPPLFLRPTRRLWLAAWADSSQGRRANQVSSGASKRLSWPAQKKKKDWQAQSMARRQTGVTRAETCREGCAERRM